MSSVPVGIETRLDTLEEQYFVQGRGYNMGFGPPATPQIIKTLLIANVAVWVAQRVVPGLTDFGAVTPVEFWSGKHLWQPFTYMWLHDPRSLWHVGFNMLSLWMFGSPLALAWGDQRFLKYYLACGVGAGFIIASVPYAVGSYTGVPVVGASGAVMGVLLAYSFSWPERTIMLIFPPIPLKAIWLIPLIFLMEFTTGPDNISHAGHLGGVLVGWLYLLQEGRTPGVLTFDGLKHKWRRYQMRQRLRAVRDEDLRDRKRPSRDDDDDQRRYH